MYFIFISIAVACIGLSFAGLLTLRIKKEKIGSESSKEISQTIHQGAMAFLGKEYKVLFLFVAAVSSVLIFSPLSNKIALTFVIGAVFSILAGNIGMRVATMANVRTAWAAEKNIFKGLKVAFSSGTVMGLTVTGMGLLGISILYWVFGDPQIIFGFGFGASSIALFARVGGGIYTKAADVGADLVGKVEKGIPEDDPRNPAVIADNVGDNVGDVAGMGADLFESYVSSIIAAMVLGVVVVGTWGKISIVLPLALASLGIISSLLGFFIVKARKSGKLHGVLNSGIFAAAGFFVVSSYFLVEKLATNGIFLFGAIISGVISGIIIGLVTQYYTSTSQRPTREVARASQSGAATNIISGFSLGMKSTLIPILVICATIIIAHRLAGFYGIGLAAVGMLSTLGITLASDTYGPVVDNAAGIAEMAKMGDVARRRAEELDAVGNTTAAIGKGFAIGSAGLTALVLSVSFAKLVGLSSIDIMKPQTMVGLFIGGLLPFLFSSFIMKAVGKAAFGIVKEVRRQFREIKGLMEGKAEPDYTRCISISTGAALKEMILPGTLAILAPVVVGFSLGAEALGGLLAGAIVTGFLLAVMMANSGGAWDNAKKYIEAGNLGGKGSETHKAAVVGDTVGDGMKDAAGPSINILIKLMSMVALIIAPLL